MENIKINKLYIYLFVVLLLLCNIYCDPAIDYFFILNNRSKHKVYINIIFWKQVGQHKEKNIKSEVVDPGRNIIIDRSLEIDKNVKDYLKIEYKQLRFNLKISINNKKFIDVTNKKYWSFKKKDNHTGIYELKITDDIFK